MIEILAQPPKLARVQLWGPLWHNAIGIVIHLQLS